MSTRTYPLRAIVLRARPVGEKDRILVLLSAERGKISAVAKGARSPKSSFAAASQPFTLTKFLLVKGRSLAIVSQAEVENAHTHLAGDLLKTAWAAYLCELADALPEEMPDEAMFNLLEEALCRLDGAASFDEIELVGRWFEARYMVEGGYAPTIGYCVACGTKISVPSSDMARAIQFSPAMGGTLCADCIFRDTARMPVKVQALRALHLLERAQTPPGPEFIEKLSLTGQARRDLKEVLQRSISAHLDIRLRSRAFLEEVVADAIHD